MRTLRLLATCIFVVGCSSHSGPPPYIPVAVKGRVVQNGQPPARGPSDRLAVTFYADQGVVPPGLIFMADAGPDGAFEITQPDKAGIPPGKYRIGVALIDGKGRDKLQGAFGPASTPFAIEVSGDSDEVVLDIGQRRK